MVVLVPVHNEAPTIGGLVRHILSLGFPVWVLDDGSSDDSGKKAEREGATVFRLGEQGQGKTAALRVGLERVSEHRPAVDWVFTCDGDGQHEPGDLVRFWAVRDRADLVVGNRLPDAAAMPFFRRWTNRAMSALLRLLYGVHVRDTQCGLRLIRTSWLRDWRPRGNRFEFETELSVLSALRRGRVENVEIRAVYGQEISKIQPVQDAVNFARLLTKLRATAR